MRFVAVGFCVVFPLLSACAIEIDPPGEGEGEGEPAGAVVRLEVDPELPEKWRKTFPALKDIRLR